MAPLDASAPSARLAHLARSVLSVREKPSSNSPAAKRTTGIVIGVIVGVILIATVSVLYFLHVRNKKRDEKEWPRNNQELEDYGIEPRGGGGGGGRRGPSTATPQNQQQKTYPQPARVEDEEEESGGERRSLEDLQRSLRGNTTTSAWKRDSGQIDADMKPVEAMDRI
ncbi:hypothetical protein GGR56DRAFT_525449 [Xylariaceae sp. FL0804]|nr:hypothetical protein GGR56DRAFT_525449 [Xylariaceae sp. FL0804]